MINSYAIPHDILIHQFLTMMDHNCLMSNQVVASAVGYRVSLLVRWSFNRNPQTNPQKWSRPNQNQLQLPTYLFLIMMEGGRRKGRKEERRG